MARPRSEKARQAVLQAMRELLARDGYEAVTIEGIAAVAEVSKQTIYRWWPSKADILGEALVDGELPGVPTALAVTDDLGADLRAWLSLSGTHLTTPQNWDLARALIAVTATNPELGETLNRRFAAPLVSWITERIELARANGDVRDDVDAVVVAEQLLATTAYAALLGRPLSPERVARIVTMLLTGITTA